MYRVRDGSVAAVYSAWFASFSHDEDVLSVQTNEPGWELHVIGPRGSERIDRERVTCRIPVTIAHEDKVQVSDFVRRRVIWERLAPGVRNLAVGRDRVALTFDDRVEVWELPP